MHTNYLRSKSKSEQSSPSFSIANFTILPSQNLVVSDDEHRSITPKMIAVLTVLATRQGETVSKDDIMAKVWSDVVVSDMVLSRAISDLRKVFGDSASQQSVKETVSKKGYRLKSPVVWLEDQPSNKKHNWKYFKRSSFGSLPSVILFVGFLISCALALRFFWPVDPPKVLTFKETNISTDDAIERRVRFSPDGKHVVYDSKQVLIVRSLKDHKPVEISQMFASSDEDIYLTGVFSPNGKELAFRRLKGKKCEIHVFNFIGRDAKYLADCAKVSSHGMDWSSNNQFIVTTELDRDKRIEYLVKIEVPTGERTVIVEPETSNTGYLFPRVSPDNRYISVLHYQRFDDQWGLGIVDLENGHYKNIYSSYEKINQVVWQDNKSLFYVIDGQNGVDAGIWEIDIASGQRRLVLNADIRDLDYNRESHQFIYTQNQKYSNVWVAHKQGAKYVDQPLLTSVFQSTEPRLSPDEKYLAYISQRSGNASLRLRDLVSEKDTELYTAKHAEFTDISWSPDGAYILGTSFTKKGNELYKLKLVDLSIDVIKSSQSTIKARWGEDSDTIYIYEKRDAQWQIVKSNAGKDIKSTRIDKAIRHFYVLDNGEQVFYQPLTSRKIFKKNFSSNDDRATLITDKALDWVVSGNNILISRWKKYNKILGFEYYDIQKESEVKVGSLSLDFPGNFLWQRPSLNVTRDSEKIYFVKTKRTHSDIFLVSFE